MTAFPVWCRMVVLSTMVLAFGLPLQAREKTDVVYLKNGDRITCEIKSLIDGVLLVSLDYVDGTMPVDWRKVVRVESTQRFVVLTYSGLTYTGTLSPGQRSDTDETIVQLTQLEGEKVEIKESEIARIHTDSESFLKRLNGSVGLGASYSKGNNATQYSFSTDADYRRERWGAAAAYESSLSANSGSTTSKRNQVAAQGFRLLPRNQYYVGGLGGFLQSSVQQIQLQTTLGGGLGRYLVHTNSTTLTVLGGVGWQNLNYTHLSVPTKTQLAIGIVKGEIRVYKFKRTNLNVIGILEPALTAPGRVRFDTNASYYLKLFSNLNWNVTFYGSWDNRPPVGLQGNDYGTSTGLSWTFGNR